VAELWRDAREQLGLPPAEAPLSPEALKELGSLPWDGNVRELRNFVERSAALSGEIDPRLLDLGNAVPAGAPVVELDAPFKDAKARWTDHFERVYLAHRLKSARGNVSQA